MLRLHDDFWLESPSDSYRRSGKRRRCSDSDSDEPSKRKSSKKRKITDGEINEYLVIKALKKVRFSLILILSCM